MSPTTTSSTWISFSSPLRITLAISLAFSAAFSAEAFPSCLLSLTEATPLATRIAIRMPTGSNHSACPIQQRMTCTTRATIRIMIIGSLKPSRTFFHNGSGGICVSEFEPCCFRLCSTSLSDKPFLINVSSLSVPKEQHQRISECPSWTFFFLSRRSQQYYLLKDIR